MEAYIEYIQLKRDDRAKEYLDLQSAVCVILYTLCKVRGYKVIVGFLNNEPRYLEPILTRIENVLRGREDSVPQEWQVPYVLLLWLSHLLLAPFDLASISAGQPSKDGVDLEGLEHDVPQIALRILRIGLTFIPSPTKAQDAAATLLVRFVTRPDMLKLRVADALVSKCLHSLQDQASDVPTTIYERLGPLRLLSLIATSAELGNLIPSIYHTCEKLSRHDDSLITSNAVAKKLMVKTFRNIANLSLRSSTAQEPLLNFLQTTNVVEDVLDYLLRSLGDRDTPVRYSAAKALSRIVLELDPAMGHEVIQAILDTFKDDMPRHGHELDFRTANALKWHGLTLALAHNLFKRSASPEQLPDILSALISALQFEQRTATGSSVGTNIRDAANFGIWSLSRRYTTSELLSVDAHAVKLLGLVNKDQSVIQGLAIQLILSACLDPAGNIRRGSSAALQELIGRHPNEVHEGISLVQIVDYQAIGLRRRAMVEVAVQASELHQPYWRAVVTDLLGWRGLGSPDVASREAAAAALAKLSMVGFDTGNFVLLDVKEQLLRGSTSDLERLHGLVLALAFLYDKLNKRRGPQIQVINGEEERLSNLAIWDGIQVLQDSLATFSTRLLRSELPSATARLLGALCRFHMKSVTNPTSSTAVPFEEIESLVEQLLSRHEETIQQAIPHLVQPLLALKRKSGAPLGCIGAQNLGKRVAIEGSKSTLHGACRAIALGALTPLYQHGLVGDMAMACFGTLAALIDAMNVDWRIVGVKSLQLAVDTVQHSGSIDQAIEDVIVEALHRSLNDYTVDERGDIGSLVRLQAISCTSSLFAVDRPHHLEFALRKGLHANIYRLSLEKLDRVRLDAAQCRYRHIDGDIGSLDVATVSSYDYFSRSLRPLAGNEPPWGHHALLEGCISCAGISAEPLLQASRAALVDLLNRLHLEQLNEHFSTFAVIMKIQLLGGSNLHPALELLAFLLDMQIPYRLTETDFKWRNLLSTVQKSHHKSNDIPKISTTVHVYRGLAGIPAIREEVLKKLISMLKTNPYPRIRSSVAETLYIITKDPGLKHRDWATPASQHVHIIAKLQEKYVQR